MLGGLIGGALDFLGLGDKEKPGYQSPWTDEISAWINQMNPGITEDINFYNQMGPQRRQAQTNAFNALDPRNNIGLARGMAQRLRAGATSQGMGQARQFAQRGFGSSVQEGARIGAMNQANDQSGQIQLSLLDPMRQAGQYQAQAGMYSPGSLLGGLQMGMGLMGQADQQSLTEFNTRRTEPGLLSNLMGVAGQVMPFMGGGGGGGAQMPQRMGTNPYMGVNKAMSMFQQPQRLSYQYGGLF